MCDFILARAHPLLVITIALALGCNGPLPFLSGGALEGEVQPPPERWAFEDDFGIFQIETRPEAPYSVNIAYTVVDERLYINAGDTETEWVQHMEADPRVRFRLDGTIFELRARRVTNPAEVTNFGDAWTSHGFFHRHPNDLEIAYVYELLPR